ncbi:DUF6452 family protein [Roseimarinus sediminis]|uniref:DUF6452 family protein n=1 Tax=Roseimarinus sediminis TaxID=1610899 RepID=UPI003D1E6509
MISRIQKVLFNGIVLMMMLWSCDELPCPDSNGVNLNVGFYTFDGRILADTTIDTINYILLNPAEDHYQQELIRVQYFSFPLSMIDDSSTMILLYKDGVSDTITFYYERLLTLESHKCGFDNFFDINDIKASNNRLDSVWIRKDLVEYGEEENIKIYF